MIMMMMVPFSVTLNDPIPHFKVMPLFDIEYLRNYTRLLTDH